jgi:CO/xanthine dehydrogenase Mo-binding subunit
LQIKMTTQQARSETMQESYFQLSRRGFIGAVGAGGITVLYHELALASKPSVALLQAGVAHPQVTPLQADSGWSGGPGVAKYRYEGLAKVTGQKIYARDFHAKDMGWPQPERAAMILRATQVDQLFINLNLSMLTPDSQPQLVITQKPMPLLSLPQQDVASLNLSLPFSSEGPPGTGDNPGAGLKELLVARGSAPLFYGQPVAILVFADAATLRRAKRLLQFRTDVVQYQTVLPLPGLYTQAYSPTTYLTRYDTSTVKFSQVQIGQKTNPYAASPTPNDLLAQQYRSSIDQALANPSYKQFGGLYSTQVLDPMFMEPEAGLAWLDKNNPQGPTLHLVLGTQATNGDMSDVFNLFSNPQASSPSTIAVKNVTLYSCYPGGGFGGRDVSTFPPLLAVTAALAGGPVRIALDRYEQFQGGLKQLSSNITHYLAVGPDGIFKAFKSQQSLGAGGNNNYSQFVAELAGYCGLSGYNITQAYVDAVAMPSKGVVAGSMRGFGGPQASFAVETLVDEAAVALKLDPIQLRSLNVLKTLDRTITGAPLTQQMTLAEICRRASAHPLWLNREATKRAKAAQGIWYGVGFALANQAYGTGTDGELTVRTNCVDMGNGSATTLAIQTAAFAGNNATHINMGDAAYFNALQMTSGSGASCNSNGKNPPACDWTNPAWTASFSMSSSACLTAFHQVHVTEQAARVLFFAGLLPAAAALWGVPLMQLTGRTVWNNAQLTVPSQPSLRALKLSDIATQLYGMKLPAGAMVHGLYQGQWVSASYPFSGGLQQLPIDGLALRHAGSSAWQVIPRQNLIPPDPKAALYGRSLFAPSGAIVAVEINPNTGRAKVVDVDLAVDAGKVLQPDLLMGQAQGGIAMGIGYALLENLPLEAGGAGVGTWNLDQYHVALASDLPDPKRMSITTLPTTESTAKGIAEAVLCPIAPAIGNAIAHATGKRFKSLPITAAQILGAKK